MTTAVDICSNALVMLGASPISSFDETSDRVRAAKNLYPQLRDYLLRSHPWNCATKRVILSPDATPPAFGYSNRFAYPSDWLRTLTVEDAGPGRYQLDYVNESRYILANSTSLHLKYIYRAPENQWDAMLVQAAIGSMRQLLAYPITTSTSLEQLITQVVANVLQAARAIDGQEDPPQTLGDELLYDSGF